MLKQKKKLGPPFSENPASKVIPPIRVRPEELETYRAAAKKKGQTLSAWVRETLGKAVKKIKGVRSSFKNFTEYESVGPAPI